MAATLVSFLTWRNFRAQTTLFGLSHSPWTYKARWALPPQDKYSTENICRGRKASHAAAPEPVVGTHHCAHFESGRAYPSSWDIACLSDRDGTLQTSNPTVEKWNRVSDRLLELGRIRISRAIQDEPDALKAALL